MFNARIEYVCRNCSSPVTGAALRNVLAGTSTPVLCMTCWQAINEGRLSFVEAVQREEEQHSHGKE